LSRRAALVTAAILVVVAAVAVFIAAGTNPSSISGSAEITSLKDLKVIEPGPQPSLVIGKGFLNTKPLSDSALKNKVVVYDFWTYSCVNCVRTLPYLEEWHERYARDGLMLVGVHSPEFEFEKNHDNVRAAVKRLGVTYPVVFDDDMDIWNAFNNQYWPAKYVTDRMGNVRYVHFGEGEYKQTEDVLRLLLGVPKGAPRAKDPKKATADLVHVPTPETYLGTLRGGGLAGQELKSGTHRYRMPKEIGRNLLGLEGDWNATQEFIESTDAHETLALNYHAGEVNLVMARTRKNPTYAVVELDGKPVPAKYRGKDLIEQDTQTIVRIDAADLYNLIANGPEGDHILRVHPGGAAVQLYAFTFGN
jgi:thiol-disulfide isomerase/thioredoxin